MNDGHRPPRRDTMPMSFFDSIPSAEAPHRLALWQSLDDALAYLEAGPGDRGGRESPASPPSASLH